MMKYDVTSATAILARTPAVLRAMLAGLPGVWVDAPEREGAWSPRDVACHLADVETDCWISRLRIMLDHGTATPIPSVPRERFRERYAGTPLDEVLNDFERAREGNLRELHRLRLDEATLSLAGVHATLGTVRVSELLATWVVHDLTHLAQISRAVAAQYRDAVGPFRDFLSILRTATPESSVTGQPGE